MESLKISDILFPLSAHLARGKEETEFLGVSIDSRTIVEGNIFFPFAGNNCDAHQFILTALQNGAVVSVANKEWPIPENFPAGKALILVDDVLQALQKMASFYREKINPPCVIGITGSNGKTTTKDLVAAVVQEKYVTLKTQGNYNNEIGVPLTLFSLTKKHQAAVLEMGMRGIGEIDELANIVHPNIGLVTNVGETHLELLGSKENIAQAKGELLEHLPASGWAVLNYDNPYVRKMSVRTKASIIYYGLEEKALVRASQIISAGEDGMKFILHISSQQIEINLPLLGMHNVYNALAAAAVGHILDFSLEEIKRGLEKVQMTGMRLEIIDNEQGIKVINDAYNASPASMAGALEILVDLAKRRSGKSIAILGNMYELGEQEKAVHYQMGELAVKLGVSKVITLGELAVEIAKGALAAGMPSDNIISCFSKDEVMKTINCLSEGDTVLIKGSRGMKMEEIVACLRGSC